MSQHADSTQNRPESAAPSAPPTLVEDLLLLLFQPDSGTIAGENTLFYILAGGVLADLGLTGNVRTGTGRLGGTTVEAVAEHPPADELLRPAWTYVADRPRGVQTVLAAVGPNLREPVLDRLVERGELRRETRKTLGLFTSSVLEDGGTGRRNALLAELRAILVDDADPSPRAAALAALVYGSGTLPQFDPEIPWTSAVIDRAEALKRGDWGASAAAQAVARTITATIVNSAVAAAAVRPNS